VSRIRSRALKFQAPHSLSSHLAIFCFRTLSHSSVTLETIALPPPSTILNPSLGARRLNPGLRARRHRPLLQAVCALPPSTLTRSPSKRVAAIDHDPASLRARRLHPLPQALDMDSGEGDTPPLPHVTVYVNVSEFD
jgi:hypothetical protein